MDHGDAWLDAVLSGLEQNRLTIQQWMREHAASVAGRPPQATYLAWLAFPDLATAEESAAQVLNRGIALSAGEEFGGPAYSGWARLNFATSDAVLQDAIHRMTAVLARPARNACRPNPFAAPTASEGDPP